jgi:hypothetical protein
LVIVPEKYMKAIGSRLPAQAVIAAVMMPLKIPAVAVGIAILANIATLGPKGMAETAPVWYNCLTREVFTPAKRTWCDRWRILQNATYTVPASLEPNPQYIQVTLQNGRYQRPDGKFLVELVNEKGWMTFGDLNRDGKQDAAVILGVALDPNGKAVATYLTVVMDVGGKARSLVPIRLGERIVLNAPLTIRDHSITVPLLTQKEVINRVYIIDETLRERF